MEEKELVNLEAKQRAESNLYNAGTKNAQLIHEITNSAMNWKPVIDKIKSGQAKDINDAVKVTENKNCFILGSGPSLDDSIQYLKEWKGGIFCTPSHALTLIYYGIEPTHILILDPFEQWSDLRGVDWRKTKTKLITHPGCRPDLIENWPNEILLYLENSGRTDSFYQDEQQKMYSWRDGDFRLSTFHYYIRTAITIFACSPPMQMFAAEILGYEKFFLAGCDFAYHSDKQRFTDYTINIKPNEYDIGPIKIMENKIEWIKNEHPLIKDNPGLVKTNSGLLSENIHIYYKKNAMSAWRLCGKTLYTTDHGNMSEVPYHDIKAVIKRQGDFPLQHKGFINKVCDEYLASVGAYVIETNKGVSFVEAADYENELPMYMAQIASKYRCNECHNQVTANPMIYKLTYNDKMEDFNEPNQMLNRYLELRIKDNIIASIEVLNVSAINHNGEECPVCKKGKIYKEIEIDIDANMNRLKEYSKKKIV